MRLLLLIVFSLNLQMATAAKRVSQATKDKLHRELPILGLNVGEAVYIRSFKKESRMELWLRPQNQQTFRLFRTYPICYYSGGLGAKRRQGDKVTPEGFYRITQKDLNPYSRFHLSMDIGYPNAYDRSLSRTGSLIMIHGACDAVGCFAMSNLQIEEIYYLVEQALANGQQQVPVHSFPFHLSDDNLKAYRNNRWYDFWRQLQVGYQLFNQEEIPPKVSVSKQGYRITSGKE